MKLLPHRRNCQGAPQPWTGSSAPRPPPLKLQAPSPLPSVPAPDLPRAPPGASPGASFCPCRLHSAVPRHPLQAAPPSPAVAAVPCGSGEIRRRHHPAAPLCSSARPARGRTGARVDLHRAHRPSGPPPTRAPRAGPSSASPAHASSPACQAEPSHRLLARLGLLCLGPASRAQPPAQVVAQGPAVRQPASTSGPRAARVPITFRRLRIRSTTLV